MGKSKDTRTGDVQVSPVMQRNEREQIRPGEIHGIVLGKWWLVEIWEEHREVFKALIVHVLAFSFFISALVLINSLLELTRLPPKHKEILETIDFYGIVLGLVIFAISFIIKLLIFAFRKQEDRHGKA